VEGACGLLQKPVKDFWEYAENGTNGPAARLANGKQCSQSDQTPKDNQTCVFEEALLTERVLQVIQSHAANQEAAAGTARRLRLAQATGGAEGAAEGGAEGGGALWLAEAEAVAAAPFFLFWSMHLVHMPLQVNAKPNITHTVAVQMGPIGAGVWLVSGATTTITPTSRYKPPPFRPPPVRRLSPRCRTPTTRSFRS